MNAPNEQDRERLSNIIKHATNQLAEHFEDVQIFACNREEGGDGTAVFRHGAGNWYARYGMVCEWVEYHKETTRIKSRLDNSESES